MEVKLTLPTRPSAKGKTHYYFIGELTAVLLSPCVWDEDQILEWHRLLGQSARDGFRGFLSVGKSRVYTAYMYIVKYFYD